VGEVKKHVAWGVGVGAICLLISVVCLLLAYALNDQQAKQTRGLDLGAPLNRPANIYGVNVHLLEVSDRDEQLAALKTQGFGWVRQEIDWQNVDWDSVGAVAAGARANGLGLVVALTGSTPPDPIAFAKFARQLAERYGDQIDYYQIWDEPNLEIGWNGPPSAAGYARVLQAAYDAIHQTDSDATVLLAGLAPTIESGPKNISDVLYLRQLYELQAAPFFDAVAGKPYGFGFAPDDRTADGGVLNFSRLILLREEMVAHGDGDKFVWGTNFGWSTRPSIWGQVTPEQQLAFTQSAFQRASDEWRWAGPMFLETPRPDEAADDPHRGFEIDLSPVTRQTLKLIPGQYAAQRLSAYAIMEGDWNISDLGLDIPQTSPATLSFVFEGADLALTVRRADYRAYLYVTVDGRAANALPTDSQGQAYLILTSPDLQPHTNTITIASGLAPGLHKAVIRADRGWDQWAIAAVEVGANVQRPSNQFVVIGCVITGAVFFLLALLTVFNHVPRTENQATIPQASQLPLALLVSLLLWASAWLTWGSDAANALRRYGDTAPLIITVITAGLLYYSPFLLLTLLCIVVLFVLFYLRPELTLPLVIFFAPFYLIPRPLWDKAFSMVEICTVLGVAAVVLRGLSEWRKNNLSFNVSWLKKQASNVNALDYSVFAFVIISGLTMFTADIQGVAIREFRVVVIESALFYLLLRVVPAIDALAPIGDVSDWRRASGQGARLIWLVVDFFILSAVVISIYGLINLATGQNLITAEGGIPRIRSVFGSPNNLGLYLGRAIPVAGAVAALGSNSRRRIAYALALMPMIAAAVLSFSRGALVFGLPAALIVILLFWGGRRAALALGVLGTLGAVTLAALSNNPRFANLFSTSSGTGFFRINVWRSAWAMFMDHPWLGVGLDNFLYAYRGRYIQPEAWQEPNLPHAHNIFLDALTRTGLLGFFALLASLISFFKFTFDVLRSPLPTNASARLLDLRPLAIGLLAAMIDILAHGMVDTAYWFVDLGFVFMLVLGLMVAINEQSVVART
jgi:O-antigen ligase